MAWGYNWDDALPDGTENADDIDLLIKDLKGGIRERMEGAFIDDWNVDPLVLKPALSGLITGLVHYIPGVSFAAGTTAGPPAVFALYDVDNGNVRASVNMIAPIRIPLGCTLTDILVFAKINSGGNCVFKIKQLTTSDTDGIVDDVPTAEVTCASNANGLYNVYTLGSLSISMGNAAFFAHWDPNDGNDRLAFVALTYNRPSHLVGA
jgi:hypothetical protein